VAAWVLIVIGTLGAVALTLLPVPGADDGEDPIGLLIMEIQARYMVGAAAYQGDGALLYAYASELDAGTIDQRQRFVVLAGELAGPAEAALQTSALDLLIQRLVDEDELVLTQEQVAVQQILHLLYPDQDIETAQVDALDEAQLDLLVDQLGWFGELALAPPGTEGPARRAVLVPANRVFLTLLSVAIVMCLAGGAGAIGLIILFVLALVGRLHSAMGAGSAPHGIYAETFAIWMFLFFGAQIGAGAIGLLLPGASMFIIALAFFFSLLVLGWPVLRGVPWSQVTRDIGWYAGRQPLLEPILGVAGYLMALPILAIGIVLTFCLLLLQTSLSGPPSPLAPTGGPAHPIIIELASGSWSARMQILLVAAVAAPIVEETMFRGVLYRHLRDASSTLGMGLSIVLSTLVNALIFAMIHPQGWVAIPALMSLAVAFSLMREWRGTVLPAILMHAISNGLVLSVLLSMLSA
jgi:membrane protease YdiL (CAAX protease family)